MVQTAQKEIAVVEQIEFACLENVGFAQALQRFQCSASPDLGKSMAMSELEHLRDKLDVDQSTAPFFEVETSFVLAGKFLFHAHAQVMNFADAAFGKSCAIGEAFDNFPDFLSEFGVARYRPRLDQRL